MLKLVRKGTAEYLQDHNLLKNLDSKDQHPIKSITGLKEALEKKRPISFISGLQEVLDSKYVKPLNGIPLSDLEEGVLRLVDFLKFRKTHDLQIDELTKEDDIINKRIDEFIQYFTEFKELNDKKIDNINLSLTELQGKVKDNKNNLDLLKLEFIKLEDKFDNLFADVMAIVGLNENTLLEIERVKHSIIDLNTVVVHDGSKIKKNAEDIQSLRINHEKLLTQLEGGDICDSHLGSHNCDCTCTSSSGRMSIEQVDKVNVKPGYSFDILTKDKDLKVLEPTVLKLVTDGSNSVDVLADFDYNDKGEFVCSDSVLFNGSMSFANYVELIGEFKSKGLDYNSYCYESLDSTPYESVISLSTDNGIIVMEHGRYIVRINKEVEEIYFKDLSNPVMHYTDFIISGSKSIDLRNKTNKRVYDYKMPEVSNISQFCEYTLEAAMIDFTLETSLMSEEESLNYYS